MKDFRMELMPAPDRTVCAMLDQPLAETMGEFLANYFHFGDATKVRLMVSEEWFDGRKTLRIAPYEPGRRA